MSWWASATVEQKLAQIDGALECKLTCRWLATNLGISPERLRQFAAEHGRTFPHRKESSARGGRTAGKSAGILAMRRHGYSEITISSAFSIFDSSKAGTDLFDPHPND